MMRGLEKLTSLARYSVASERAAGQIIGSYSTSFGAATRLLGVRHRAHIRNIYALVRIADELVDGVTTEAGVGAEQQHKALSLLEQETEQAIETGYSSNPIVHAFAQTARSAAITPELTRPFFSSMRADIEGGGSLNNKEALTTLRSGDFDHADYVFGSAEVVGLMCLQVFIREESNTPEELRVLKQGARSLGAAFQNVNFLRDIGDDTQRLGRNYLGIDGQINSELQSSWIAVIKVQLADAEKALPLLPRDARVAVKCAHRLFSRLLTRIEKTPAAELHQHRVRVPGREKALLLVQSAFEYQIEQQKGRIA